jgi:hypothetical protein
MKKEEIKAAIMEALGQEVDIWLTAQEQIKDGYEYEDKFMKVAQKVNQIVFSKSMGPIPVNRNKKNFRHVLER